MAFIIPNAIDTTGSNRYNSLDQAEPDALDFQLLGNRSTGVLSGCEVAAQTVANYTVTVTSGYVLLDGVVYPVSSNPSLSLPAVPSNNRFDILVARLVSGSMVLTVVSGPDSASNPSFPPTPDRMTTTVGVPVNTYINPDTDVILASVFRAGAASITKAHIVDKRVNIPTTTLRGDSVPSNTFGNNGDLYYKSDLAGDAGLYVKITGTWIPLTGVTIPEEEEAAPVPVVLAGGGVPVGSVITWVASTAPDTTAWVECNGQAISRTGTYSALFGVLGTTYGTGDGSTTFNVPDFRGHFLMGLPTGRNLGTAYGAQNNQVTISTAQLPQHNHSATGLQTVANGDHNHSTDTNGNPNYIAGIMLRSSLAASSSGSLTFQTSTTGKTLGVGSTNNRGSHQHTITGNTGDTGSGSALTIEPRNYGVRYFIKYA